MSEFPTVGGQKYAGKHLLPVCDMYVTSHKEYLYFLWGIRLLCDV